MKGMILMATSIILFLCVVTIVRSEERPVAVWLFDEESGKVIKDFVGNNDGEIEGSVERTNESQFGRALKFPGKGDSYVSIPHNDIFDSNLFTLAVWVKLEPASWQYIAWEDGLAWPEVHKKRHIDIWVHQAGYVVLMWHTEAGAEGRTDGKTIITDSQWHHVAEVSDGKNMMLYIDGKLDSEAEIGGKLVVNGEDPLWIGARPGNVAATGIFDEVGFFTKALSKDELTNVMNKGLAKVAAVSPLGELAITWGEVKSE